MKTAKTPKNLKEMPYPPQKKLLKRKGNSITIAKTNAPISQASSERLKLTKKNYASVNLFSSDTCFIYFISDVPHYIRWNQHNTANLVKVYVLDTCGAIYLYFGIAFLLFFMKIGNTDYTSFQNSTPLFISGLIFDIMNIQNNQSPKFEWIPMLAPLRSVNN